MTFTKKILVRLAMWTDIKTDKCCDDKLTGIKAETARTGARSKSIGAGNRGRPEDHQSQQPKTFFHHIYASK